MEAEFDPKDRAAVGKADSSALIVSDIHEPDRAARNAGGRRAFRTYAPSEGEVGNVESRWSGEVGLTLTATAATISSARGAGLRIRKLVFLAVAGTSWVFVPGPWVWFPSGF